MDDTRRLLCHFLATLAYRTKKALRDAPPDFGRFRAMDNVRTPAELVQHMTSVLAYAKSRFESGPYLPDPLPSLEEEALRFLRVLQELALHLEKGTALRDEMSLERLTQGPFADAMTHAGQLAMLRRFAGSPVPQESFIDADISAERLGSDQARPGESD